MEYLRQTLAIAGKDLRSEMRTKEAINASLAFSLVILLLFSFAFDPGNSDIDIPAISGGMLWMAFSFAGALSLNRSFARELQNDCLDALVASPAPPSALFTGKALANFTLLFTVELAVLGIFSVMYNTHIRSQFWPLLGVVVLTTWGITVIGTTFSALTVNLRMRELMLPILTYPFLTPALLAAILLTTDLLAGMPISAENMIWVRVLVFFDVVFTGMAVVFIEFVLVG